MDFAEKARYDFADLKEIIAILRHPEDGCPWDREQTHGSIRKNFIEECYEAVEAIDRCDAPLLREELGDVMMQVLLHARMEEEQGSFSVDDVVDELCKKLVFRHPHVFGTEEKAGDAGEVLDIWNRRKYEKKGVESKAGQMRSVGALPALMRADKIQGKAAKFGFDYADASDAFLKVEEELAELREARGTERMAEEAGDLLFAAVNAVRLLGVEPEEALDKTTDKFIRRIEEMETLAEAGGESLDGMDLQAMDELWEKVKQKEKA